MDTSTAVKRALNPVHKSGQRINANIGGTIHNNPEEWNRIDQIFQDTKDSKGISMKEYCERQAKG